MHTFIIREDIETTDETFLSDDESSISPEQEISPEQLALNNALCRAAHLGNSDEVIALLAQGANPNARVHATTSTDVDDPTTSGYKNEIRVPVLMLAARAGHMHIVQTLFAAGANINAMVSLAAASNIDPALSQLSLLTCALGHKPLFQWLLTVVSPAVKAHILHFVVQRVLMTDVIQILEWLEDMKTGGVDLDVLDHAGHTALMTAAIRGHLLTVSALLQLGANPDIAEPRTGHTPLLLATASGNLRMIELLIKGHANIHVKGIFASTLLHVLAAMPVGVVTVEGRKLQMMSMPEQCMIARLLLTKGIDINAVASNDGSTALITVVQAQKYELVQLFLQHGAHIGLQDKKGYNALDYALMCQDIDFNILDALCERAKDNLKLFIEAILLAAQMPDQKGIDRMLTHRVDDGIQPTLKYLAAARQVDLLVGLYNGQRENAENALIQAMIQSVNLDRSEGLDLPLFYAVHAATVLLVAADTSRPLSDAKKWMAHRDMVSIFDSSSFEAKLAIQAANTVVKYLLNAGCRDHRLLAPLLYRGKEGFEETLAVAIADFYANKSGSAEVLATVKAALAVGERMLTTSPRVAAPAPLRELFSRRSMLPGPFSSSSSPESSSGVIPRK